MNIIFQNDYFPEEQELWEDEAALVVSGLCREEHIDGFEPLIARGTIAFHNSTKLSLYYKGWPDITWPFNNNWNQYGYRHLLNCSDLLNYDAVIAYLSGECLLSTPKWIRSESGSKQFSGGVFDYEQFMAEKEYLQQKSDTPMCLVVANPKKIGKEWRIVIVGHEVVSMSQYMDKGEPKTTSKVPYAVQLFAEQWMDKHKMMFPDSYVLDVCDHAGVYKVVEVNNLLTSSFYDADLPKIIRSIVEHVTKSTQNYGSPLL